MDRERSAQVRAAVERVCEELRLRDRGWDDPAAGLVPAAIPGVAVDDPPPDLLGEKLSRADVKGSLRAVSELSGWWAATARCEPSPEMARPLWVVASELEEMCRSLRLSLEAIMENGAE
jgi:hypothetical protein